MLVSRLLCSESCRSRTSLRPRRSLGTGSRQPGSALVAHAHEHAPDTDPDRDRIMRPSTLQAACSATLNMA